jgi:hypothetical protein
MKGIWTPVLFVVILGVGCAGTSRAQGTPATSRSRDDRQAHDAATPAATAAQKADRYTHEGRSSAPAAEESSQPPRRAKPPTIDEIYARQPTRFIQSDGLTLEKIRLKNLNVRDLSRNFGFPLFWTEADAALAGMGYGGLLGGTPEGHGEWLRNSVYRRFGPPGAPTLGQALREQSGPFHPGLLSNGVQGITAGQYYGPGGAGAGTGAGNGNAPGSGAGDVPPPSGGYHGETPRK